MRKYQIIRRILTSSKSAHLITAGAGTGKTELLKELVKRIRRKRPESSILFLGSINKTLDVAIDRGVAADERTNFHRFGYALIRKYSRYTVDKRYLKCMGYPCHYKLSADYVVLGDEKTQLKLLTELAGGEKAQATAVMNHLAYKFAGRATMVDPPLVGKYMRYKARNKCIDFYDMILLARGLLKQERSVRKSVAREFQFILLDESQDIFGWQWDILALMKGAGAKLVAVGDPMQLAYGFLGADFHWHRRLADHHAGDIRSYRLNRSYRCPKEICDLSNALTQDAQVEGKTAIYSRKTSGAKPKVIFHFSDHRGVEFVVSKVTSLLRRGKSPEDIAILFRALKTEGSGRMFAMLKRALKKKKLPITYKDCDESNPQTDSHGKIVISTIHGFKGDGRKVIFICGVDNQSTPFDGKPSDEERAILNIAVTRSSELLFLTCKQTLMRREASLSKFLFPLRGKELFSEVHLRG